MKNIRYIGAGAGSGKTFDLTEKIVSMVLDGCKMSEFILTTFTKKAAAEFRRKTREKLLAKADKEANERNRTLLITAATELDSALIGTVHSVCMQYIRKYWYKLGISARVKEMDEDAKKEHISRTVIGSADEGDIAFFIRYANELGLWKEKEAWQTLLSGIINDADSFDIKDLEVSERKSHEMVELILKDDGCSIIEHAEGKNDAYYRGLVNEYVTRLFKIARKWKNEFARYKEEHALIEFCDMETKFLELLKDEEVRSEIASSIKYLFVDEFQDSNPKQVKIFDALSDLVRTSFWVGDPKQAIFGFRGSDIALVHAVINNKDGSVTKDKPLEYSWRSEKRLVETSNTIFKRVFEGQLDEKEIELMANRDSHLPGGARSLHHWDLVKGPKLDDESKFGCTKDMLIAAVAAQVASIIKGEHPEISKVIDKNTGEERRIVPSDIAILTRSGDDAEGKDGYEYIQALKRWNIPVIHNDTICAINHELIAVSLILNYMVAPDSTLLHAELCRVLLNKDLEDILKTDPESFKKELGKLDDLKAVVGNGSIAGIVRSAVIRLDLLNRCAMWGLAEERRRNLTCLINAAEAYDADCLSAGQSATVEGFLAEISQGVPVPDGYFGGGVTVCTYHKSKGLEWNVVILTGLASDSTSEKKNLERYTQGVRAIRIGTPDPSNIYSEYYLSAIPPISSSAVTGEAKKAILASDGYNDYCTEQKEEAQRLLYVGFTRARDYLISTSNRQNGQWGKMAWFDAIGLPTDIVDPYWPNESLQTVWGPDTEPCFFRKIVCMKAPEVPAQANYRCLPDCEPDATEEPSRILPSAIPMSEDLSKVALRLVGSDDAAFTQIVKTVSPQDRETAIGTCIHNIFAAYDPKAPLEESEELARRTVRNFQLGKYIPEPESLIKSISGLYDYLTATYGPAVAKGREIPFREIHNGQTCVGSIDFVWYTSDKECVLVDYKNLSMATAAVVDPDSEEYIGHYIPQQKAYKDALERSGLKVRDCILHLSLQGRVIVIDF